MDARQVALLQARGRMAVGAALMVAPELSGRFWIGSEARSRATAVFARSLGARDLALGLGVAIALDRGAPVRGWLEGSALADAADFAATLVAAGSIPESARRGVLAVAAASTVTALALARALREPEGRIDAPEAAITGHPAV